MHLSRYFTKQLKSQGGQINMTGLYIIKATKIYFLFIPNDYTQITNDLCVSRTSTVIFQVKYQLFFKLKN